MERSATAATKRSARTEINYTFMVMNHKNTFSPFVLGIKLTLQYFLVKISNTFLSIAIWYIEKRSDFDGDN
ncbi:hypothetical protein [Lysinibacillus sp. fls2-241-R2A-57]|uniref:hypothetical protein n=1 Tax=Lysinibacillus sp. fls2-241-R2A-57 TaxID=3040292 RepID=UPI0025528A06|nr:hypothetical protein [Lysinibacillus sp. fls2-241-R2A-57]